MLLGGPFEGQVKLPESIGQLSQLQALHLFENELSTQRRDLLYH
jgi:hypothetical protein